MTDLYDQASQLASSTVDPSGEYGVGAGLGALKGASPASMAGPYGMAIDYFAKEAGLQYGTHATVTTLPSDISPHAIENALDRRFGPLATYVQRYYWVRGVAERVTPVPTGLLPPRWRDQFQNQYPGQGRNEPARRLYNVSAPGLAEPQSAVRGLVLLWLLATPRDQWSDALSGFARWARTFWPPPRSLNFGELRDDSTAGADSLTAWAYNNANPTALGDALAGIVAQAEDARRSALLGQAPNLGGSLSRSFSASRLSQSAASHALGAALGTSALLQRSASLGLGGPSTQRGSLLAERGRANAPLVLGLGAAGALVLFFVLR